MPFSSDSQFHCDECNNVQLIINPPNLLFHGHWQTVLAATIANYSCNKCLPYRQKLCQLVNIWQYFGSFQLFFNLILTTAHYGKRQALSTGWALVSRVCLYLASPERVNRAKIIPVVQITGKSALIQLKKGQSMSKWLSRIMKVLVMLKMFVLIIRLKWLIVFRWRLILFIRYTSGRARGLVVGQNPHQRQKRQSLRW